MKTLKWSINVDLIEKVIIILVEYLFQGYVEKLQIELQSCQENYLDAVDKCSALEEELKECKEKLSLYKQDDLGNNPSNTVTANQTDPLTGIMNWQDRSLLHWRK